MENKFLYFKKRRTFDSIVEQFPADLSPLCFIEDSNEIWFEHHFFQAGHESLRVEEMNGTIIVALSDTSFTLVPGSSSIQLRAQENAIVISSSALTRIDTDDQLEWKENKLYHKESGIEVGTYGPKTTSSGVNILKIPKVTFNKYGHATSAETVDITIRDYVEQRSADESDTDRQLLLSERSSNTNDVNVSRKGKGLTYNNYSQLLKAGSLELSGSQSQSLIVRQGDLIVENGTIIGRLQGEVTGTATPKIHLSNKPEYGGASTNMFGHVKLVDTIVGTPSPSSDNQNENASEVEGLAASPYLVYNYVQANKFKVNGITANKQTVEVNDRLDFTDDFVLQGNKVSIGWTEL